MDRPPGGWSDLVTNHALDLRSTRSAPSCEQRCGELRSELRSEVAGVRMEMANLGASVDRRLRAQTWMMMTTMIAGGRAVGDAHQALTAITSGAWFR